MTSTSTAFISVTAPTGTGTYGVGDRLTASWAPSWTPTTGQFAGWAMSSNGSSYYPLDNASFTPTVAGASSYTKSFTLTSSTGTIYIPGGTGYRIVVGWRTGASGAWTVFGTSAGTFTVTGTSTSAITVTAPSGSYQQGASILVQWSVNPVLPTGGQFAVWAVTSGGTYYLLDTAGDFRASNDSVTSYQKSYVIGALYTATQYIPVGTGYHIVVGYKANLTAGLPWTIWGTSGGTFSVTAAR